MEPQVRYYQEFNLKNAGLEQCERRVEEYTSGEADVRDHMSNTTRDQRAEYADEREQILLFDEGFYPVDRWLKEKGRPPIGLSELNEGDRALYFEELAKR
jgi:hypothetical protein